MSRLKITVRDLELCKNKSRVNYIITRLESFQKVDDIDVLVKSYEYEKFISVLRSIGYKKYSHDRSLGGRIKGLQKNLVKKGRVKIDLHRDFSWRRDRHLDSNLIWSNIDRKKIFGYVINVPSEEYDAFLVLINVIFEKTYLTQGELNKIWPNLDKIGHSTILYEQARIYGWNFTLEKFLEWAGTKKTSVKVFPVFIPITLVILSYLEKIVKKRTFHPISILYYFYFRSRYFINKRLPYD